MGVFLFLIFKAFENVVVRSRIFASVNAFDF